MAADSSPAAAEYVVVARRYRPQSFEELIGQQQVVQALQNAILKNRVGHAYLFTGARGVGKTSAARIFAKALNCQQGASPEPCNQCDICLGIVAGGDIDVLEIDGASNRGIDEIRQLRANVSVRPSRARLKIYIIDEVHMLTTPAFNALLKTLEEPPEHVKFIFCTTDPEKIPITVLSRCQRFDFAPVEREAIVGRLQQIVEAEKVTAEPAALELLSRRAAGSMRDSQSLLEQLLSFCGDHISEADVYSMLGAASVSGIADLIENLANRDAAAALGGLEAVVVAGADASQVAEQLLQRYRDLMAAAVGASSDLFVSASAGEHAALEKTAGELGLEAILATLQILDQTVSRMRQSLHGRLLMEMALVRICSLENLSDLSSLIAEIRSGTMQQPAAVQRPAGNAASNAGPATAAAANPARNRRPEEKKTDSLASPPKKPETAAPLTDQTALGIWKQVVTVLEDAEDTNAVIAKDFKSVASSGPNRLVVTFPATYTFQKAQCERP